jgi:hypothetical protein
LLRLQFIWEDSRQSRKVERIVLKRGAILELEARVNGQTIAATNFQAQLVPKEGQFDGLFTRRGNQLISRKVPVGDFAVRACAQLNGTNYFSEGLHLSGVAGQTNIVSADLKPGLSVEGKLMGIDGAVRNGWVNARVINSTAGQLMSWADYGEVHPDGSFRLSGLPAGQLEVVAICDGYLSENGTNTILSIVKPHRFELPREERIEIPMRRSAVARIRVLGPKDERVAGASVNFWPNVQWGGYWTTIFATDFYREMEVLGKKLEGPGWGRDAKRTFFAETGEDGWAVVRELPPVALTFFVEHGDLELPLKDGGRESSIELNAGETNLTAVKLQVKSGEMRD